MVVGLGSMIGAGVFAAFAPAARAAGSWLLLSLLIAAAIAYCNATASAQLAAEYPESGGTYVYANRRLGPWWGFLAGWAFVVGKTASCAAMALTFAAYAAPGSAWAHRLVAVLAVAVLTAVNCRGVTRTAGLARWLVAVSGTVLLVVVIIIAASGHASLHPLGQHTHLHPDGVYGVLQAGGLLFFAFAGYARIATLGEEVVDPARTIPRAILTALGITVLLYLVVGCALLAAIGPAGLAASAAPVEHAVRVVGAPWAAPLVRVGAAAASLGALLALLAGVGRTGLAMARAHDLPGRLAAVDPRFRVPAAAQIACGTVAAALAATVDLRGVIGFSSVGVLVYYALANASALTQTGDRRRWPRATNAVGVAGCAVLVLTLPPSSVLIGLAVLVVGLAGRWVARRAASLDE